jgi:excisionase family DNA binding protein
MTGGDNMKNIDELNPMLTVKDLAQFLGINYYNAFAFIREQKIPYVRFSERRIRILKEDLVEWLNNNKKVS